MNDMIVRARERLAILEADPRVQAAMRCQEGWLMSPLHHEVLDAYDHAREIDDIEYFIQWYRAHPGHQELDEAFQENTIRTMANVARELGLYI